MQTILALVTLGTLLIASHGQAAPVLAERLVAPFAHGGGVTQNCRPCLLYRAPRPSEAVIPKSQPLSSRHFPGLLRR